MNRFSLLLAYKYMQSRETQHVATMVAISCISIAIGSCALMLTWAIMNGFEHDTHKRLQSIHAPITIRAFGQPLDVTPLSSVLKKEFPEIKAFSAHTRQQIMIEHADDSRTKHSIVAATCIDPQSYAHVNALQEKISLQEDKTISLCDVVGKNRILIGEKLAQSLGITTGDIVDIVLPEEQNPDAQNLSFQKASVAIGGIFKTGIQDFDAHLIFVSFDHISKIIPDLEATHMSLALYEYANEELIIQKLKKRLGLEVYSWKDLYPALLAALTLEKYVACAILLLITLIASMNIISLIFMQIQQKKSDIAILNALGAPSHLIQNVFMYMGLCITGCASIVGVLIALGILWFLKHYPCITLPDAYFVTTIPVLWYWWMPFAVCTIALAISFCTLYICTKKNVHACITEQLRHHGHS